jgi:hypothetical protein
LFDFQITLFLFVLSLHNHKVTKIFFLSTIASKNVISL